ncbi:hypothetical protein [Vibrio phage BONAISHI]|nr:hypothetical protein [Vibrio phage BONAISHI]
MIKQFTAFILLAFMSLTVSAVTLEHTVHHGTSQAVTQVNKIAEIEGESHAFKFVKDRDVFAGDNTGGAADVDNYVVSAGMTLSHSVMDLTQESTGVSKQNTYTNYTAISAGDLTAVEGTRNVTGKSNINTVNEGYTLTTTAEYEVSTSADKEYTHGGSKPGNDVVVKINDFQFGTEDSQIDISKAFDQALAHVDPEDISVIGQDLNHADENGIELNWAYREAGVTDESSTRTKANSNTYTIFSSIE